ncbi:MAG: hypothetical protein JYX80_09375 [Candidatus Scalindua sediminis]|nr:hypothetical protein [Candidatus Scalindua sediminis]
MITIVDVIENYFNYQDDKNLLTIPGRRLFDFGEEVRRYASSFTLPKVSTNLHPIYLGGWPSSNFWDTNQNKYIYSSLLYAGQILVKDPICDWFCNEQYQLKTFLSSRQGYINTQQRKLNTFDTRQYLSIVIPQLLKLKPLIQSGIVIPIPSKIFQKDNRGKIDNIFNDLKDNIDVNIINEITKNFSPRELSVDDNKKGLFLFTHENKEEQLAVHIRDTLYYFINEYMLSSSNGFYYTAPYDYENYLLEKFIKKSVEELPGTSVINALLNSELYIHSGLTPKTIFEIRNDDNFSKLRENLYDIYDKIPSALGKDELNRYLNELESTKIKPILDDIYKSSTTGILSKIGIGIAKSGLRIASAVFTGQYLSSTAKLGDLSIAAGIIELINTVTNLNKTNKGSQILWKKIFAENEYANNHFVHYQSQMQQNSIDEWPINMKIEPMQISVSSGALFWDRIKNFDTSGLPKDFPIDDIYQLCNCGSRRKFKFCCKGLEKFKFNTTKHKK